MLLQYVVVDDDVLCFYTTTILLVYTVLLLVASLVQLVGNLLLHYRWHTMLSVYIATTCMQHESRWWYTVVLAACACSYLLTHNHYSLVASYIVTTGVAGMLYVTTGIHGGHVLVGMILILLCTLQWHVVSLYSPSSTDCIHGVLSVVLYWHFVDVVWLSVVYVVYCGQLVLRVLVG